MLYRLPHLALATMIATLFAGPAATSAQTPRIGLPVPADTDGPPPRFLDEAMLRVQLRTGGSSEDYKFGFSVSGEVHGHRLQQADAIRAEYKVGGRVLTSVRCSIEGFDGFGWPNVDGYSVGRFACTSEQVIDTAADAEIQLTYQDDADDRNIAFRPLQIRVGAAPSRVSGDDYNILNFVDNRGLLGASTIWLRDRPFGRGPKVMFSFWANPGHDHGRPDDVSFRCYVNGERIRERIHVGGTMMHQRGGDVASFAAEDRSSHEWGYRYYEVSTAFAFGGRGGSYDNYDLIAHPGDYRCVVKVDGNAVREFLFTVTAEGIAAHPEQLGEGALYLAPGRALVQTRFPSPESWDQGIDVDAIRAGSFYGRPWRDAASMAPTFESLPAAAVGSLDPPSAPRNGTVHGFARPAAAAARRRGRGRGRGRGRRR